MPRAAGEANGSGIVINCRAETQKALLQDAGYSRPTLYVKNLNELKAVLIDV
jgi:hypothetical protein